MRLLQGLIRTTGIITLVLSFWGFYYLAEIVRRALIHPVEVPEAPLFRQVFWAMNLLNAVFLVAMILIAVGLVRLKLNAVRLYTWLYVALLVYAFAPGLLWGRGPLGMSIAAASGVGAVGIGPLVLFPIPFVYAVVSVLLVNLAMRKLARNDPTFDAERGSITRTHL